MAVLFKPILALHITNFSSCRNYWRGQSICLPPNIFMGARLPPPPPESTPLGGACQLKNCVPPYENPRPPPPQCPPTEKILATPLYQSNYKQ